MLTTASLPDDIEALRSLVRERDAAIGVRDATIVQRESTIDEYAREIEQLREYVRLLRSQRFGASSERIHHDQLGLFNEAEQILDEADGEIE